MFAGGIVTAFSMQATGALDTYVTAMGDVSWVDEPILFRIRNVTSYNRWISHSMPLFWWLTRRQFNSVD